MKLYARGTFQVSHPLKNCLPQVVNIIVRVLVLHYLHGKMDLLVVAIALEERVVFGNVVVNLDPQSHSCLVCPASRHIFYGVTTTSNHHRRYCEP